MTVNPKLQNIQDALKAALGTEFMVEVIKDRVNYFACARREFATTNDCKTGGYFFCYAETEKDVVKDLSAQVEQFLRTRLDMCRTGLNTLLASE